jgi:hypothetical protein
MPASFSSASSSIDKLIAGPADLLHSRKITLVTGENRARGAVLGKTATAGTIAGAAAAGNIGNGTIGSLTIGAAAKEGVYRAIIIEPATNAGAFAVYDPDGVLVGHGTVAVAFTGAVNFTIADGGTDFVSGDTFNITVSAVTYKHKLSAAAATDGSEVPDVILAEPTDATAADVSTVAYDRGDFAESALVLGAGHTAASIREIMRAKGITLVPIVAA